MSTYAIDPKLRIAIGADHAAFELKSKLTEALKPLVADWIDVGTHDAEKSVDYPDFSGQVCKLIQEGKADYGILLCGSGIGMSISANKHVGIRAGVVWNTETAKLLKEHNNAHIICIGARFIAPWLATEMVKTFLTSNFEGGNHARRLAKIG